MYVEAACNARLLKHDTSHDSEHCVLLNHSVPMQIANLHKSLTEAFSKQREKKDFEEPVFKVSEVQNKVSKIEQFVKRINKRSKPPPPKPIAADNATSTNGTNSTEGLGEINPSTKDPSDGKSNQSSHSDPRNITNQDVSRHDEL